jgi:hypothetical protein
MAAARFSGEVSSTPSTFLSEFILVLSKTGHCSSTGNALTLSVPLVREHGPMPTTTFRPGDRVPTTGIYTATHYQHRMPHEVFAVEGERFPFCRRCRERAHFTLLHHATRIEEDQDFTRSGSDSTGRKVSAASRKES